MSHLLHVERKPSREPIDATAFPFSLPIVRTLERLELGTPVTFFVGENGSGKSTLLEAIAIASELATLGHAEAAFDISLAPQRQLASALRLAWSRRSRRGFFLRAEDFFGYLKRESRTDARILREEREAREGRRPPTLDDDATTADERDAARFIGRRDARSHGESFLELFEDRMQPGGLYLLDEPEAPLSPKRQMAFLALLQRYADQDAQFLIATHSPLLLAYRGARIYDFDRQPLRHVAYEALEHVRVTRHVLDDPERAMYEVREGYWSHDSAETERE